MGQTLILVGALLTLLVSIPILTLGIALWIHLSRRR